MALFNGFNTTLLDMATEKHNFTTDTYKFMLSDTAPVATNTIKTDLTEIAAGNGYAAGGPAVDLTASQAAGVLSVSPAADITITASGGTVGPFRYVTAYNDTDATKPLVSFYDYGSSITLNDGESLTIDMGATLFTAAFA